MQPPARRRVVVTGLGAVTPVGNTRDEFWRRLIAGESGIAPITAFDAALFDTRIAGEVKDWYPEQLIGRKEARRMDRFTQFALVAAREAIEDAKLPDDPEFKERVGGVVGTGIGGIITFWLNSDKANENGTWSKVTPFFIPMLMANAAPAHISMAFGYRGPFFAAASACASANDAICTAYNAVAHGDAIAMITGGSEATVSPLAIGGFCSMRAMSTRNDEPTRASRPFDRERDGFVLGEGAGILVLEDYEHAKARGASIYCEVLGYGQSSDAYDLVAPDPEGNGVRLAFARALASAGIEPSDVDYINAHGTSTPVGDPAESKAIEKTFGEHAYRIGVSSTKSMHGHALGAAGGIEGVATVLAVRNDVMPPTTNYEYPDPECRLDYVPNVARSAPIRIALSNSFGFGGHNSVIVFAKVSPE
ncbi:MAG TPA: beta-ketoacyl-ACP synthase II [Candidatus Baltobacteraceae bacterium]|jgi:3-oxoacyl-[acyl-carrier-protein] synthase II|nr:beta-ketoacyl-ACP synthase II [Candidatus Baltobacteraceae bacterium]